LLYVYYPVNLKLLYVCYPVNLVAVRFDWDSASQSVTLELLEWLGTLLNMWVYIY
jgi:hypothetical protein